MQTNDDEMSGKMRTWIVIVSILLPILFSELIEWLFK